MATQLFYKMLIEKTAVDCDQDHLNTIILSHASMPDRTAAILSGDEQKIDLISKKMYEDAHLLEELGCLAIGVTCNTAHYFVDMISDKIGIPFIHMIKETAKETAKTLKNEKVGILATDGTIETKLYQNALRDEGVIPCTLDSHGQGLVMHEIYDRIKAGLASEDESWQEIDEKLKEMGCKKALLACTELSVIKNERKLSDYYVDPMEVMADKTLKFMKKNQIKHI